jgi:hypothetical protein
VLLCTVSYLAALDESARGCNPENFLLDQLRDHFSARWPPRNRNPAEERRKRDSEKFHLLIFAAEELIVYEKRQVHSDTESSTQRTLRVPKPSSVPGLIASLCSFPLKSNGDG